MGTAANGSLLIILPLCIGNRNLNKIYSYIKLCMDLQPKANEKVEILQDRF